MSRMNATARDEIAAGAARWVVEQGLEYGAAKRRAARELGLRDRDLPDNLQVENAVREYLELFCADTQPGELAVLRQIALRWMERLASLRPYVTGAVWRGTATHWSAVHLELYTDDPKAAELLLLDRGVDYEVGSTAGPRGQPVDVLSVAERSRELGEVVTVHLTVLDHDDLRGALRPDASGQTWRGDATALRERMARAGQDSQD